MRISECGAAQRASRVGTQPAIDAGFVEDMRAGWQLADLLASCESLQADRALAHLRSSDTGPAHPLATAAADAMSLEM